ncbi:unnamed protein product, partial [Mesorhabditis belari]|uniref:Uncharacterized protein n=1 Tax=Mesorhabditis belari TaxID=2138241 RepID=A0AAF3J9G7_9BILA
MLLFESRKPSYGSSSGSLQIEMGGSPTMARKVSGLKRMFKLRRTPSDEGKECLGCNDTEHHQHEIQPPTRRPQQCQLKARDISVQLESRLACRVVVTSPNAESSQVLSVLPDQSEDVVYEPMQQGCGHGFWTIKIIDIHDDQKVLGEQTLHLSGWGSILVTITEDFSVLMKRLDFLESPIAISCGY